MNDHLWSPVFLVTLLLVSTAFGAIQAIKAQETPILGYPYGTNGGEGGELNGYRLWGSSFTLNGDATLTSMSCKMTIYYGSDSHTNVHYRFAVYQDNNETVGTLIAQTEEDTANPVVNEQWDTDQWRTANFASPVSLQAGKYWLMEISEAKYVSIHTSYFHDERNLEPWNQSRLALTTNLTSINFPVSFDSSICHDIPALISIYASGQGVSSVLPPPPASKSPMPSHVSLSAMTVNSADNVQILGSLISNNTGVPLANMTFSYRSISDNETDLHQFATINTDSNGNFSVNWQFPDAGSYIINATYHGSPEYGPVFDGINVLVTGDETPKVFSVESNSTVTGIEFKQESSELNLSVTGQSGTIGFVDLYVSKSLVENVSAIQSYVDGNPVSFTVTSTDDSWILHFYYHHSSHNIMFDLSEADISSVPEMPKASSVPEMSKAVLLLIIVALVAIGAVLMIVQKRRRTNLMISAGDRR